MKSDAFVFSVACSPDGTMLAARNDQLTRIWDPFSGELLGVMKCDDIVYSVVRSPNGTTCSMYVALENIECIKFQDAIEDPCLQY